MRLVPAMLKYVSLPYLDCSSLNFSPMVSMASSQVMRCQPGSLESFGFVRFMGYFRRSG